MGGYSMAVYTALNDTEYRMLAQKNANRELRKRISETCARFPNTPGLETMLFPGGKVPYFPVIFASSTAGFMGMKFVSRCLLGVSMSGVGTSPGSCSFEDMLIGFSDFNEHTIGNVLTRALQGDPMSFEEWEQQKGQAATNIVNYGNDNTIGGRDASRW